MASRAFSWLCGVTPAQQVAFTQRVASGSAALIALTRSTEPAASLMATTLGCAARRTTTSSGISRPVRVEMGGQIFDGPSALLCVCNGRYYGGGFLPVPEAMPDDGVLDMLYVNKVSLHQLPGIIGNGGRAHHGAESY